MSDKRPWSPGPWENVLSQITIVNKHSEENWNLCLKAPEMAELLIELVTIVEYLSEHVAIEGRIEEIADISKKLLKEVGYDPE